LGHFFPNSFARAIIIWMHPKNLGQKWNPLQSLRNERIINCR
jgi:hypothetical protein